MTEKLERFYLDRNMFYQAAATGLKFSAIPSKALDALKLEWSSGRSRALPSCAAYTISGGSKKMPIKMASNFSLDTLLHQTEEFHLDHPAL